MTIPIRYAIENIVQLRRTHIAAALLVDSVHTLQPFEQVRINKY